MIFFNLLKTPKFGILCFSKSLLLAIQCYKWKIASIVIFSDIFSSRGHIQHIYDKLTFHKLWIQILFHFINLLQNEPKPFISKISNLIRNNYFLIFMHIFMKHFSIRIMSSLKQGQCKVEFKLRIIYVLLWYVLVFGPVHKSLNQRCQISEKVTTWKCRAHNLHIVWKW